MKALIVGYFKVDPMLLEFYSDYGNEMGNYGYEVLRYELGEISKEADFGGESLRPGSMLKLLGKLLKEFLLLPVLCLKRNGNIELVEMQAMSKSPILWLKTYFKIRNFSRDFKECLVRNDVRYVLLTHQFSGYHIVARGICEALSIPLAYWHPGFLPGTMAFDYTGQMAESDFSLDIERYGVEERSEWVSLGLEYVKHAKVGKYLRPGKSNNLNGEVLEFVEQKKKEFKKLILVIGSNDYRTGVMPASYENSDLHSAHYKSSDQLFEDISSQVEKDVYVIYKPHPNLHPNGSGIKEVSERSAMVFDAPLRHILKSVDVSASICSSGSFEAIIAGVPAVVVGHLPGSSLGFFFSVSGRWNELESALKCALEEGLTSERRRKFLNFVGFSLSHYFFSYGENSCPLVTRGLADSLAQVFENVKKA